MSLTISGVVSAINSKEVKTKFGVKPVYELVVEGETYKCGFKKPPVKEGMAITLNYDPGKYGNDVVEGSITSDPGRVSTPTPPIAPRNYGGSKGVFPIPGDDGQRSILRQNAVTNAREAIGDLVASGALAHDASKGVSSEDVISAYAQDIITMAKLFEAYTSGDADEEAVRKELNA